MTTEEIENYKRTIDSMSQTQLAYAWRFAEVGDPIFSDHELFQYFRTRFDSLGGMTPEISKLIGWDKLNESE